MLYHAISVYPEPYECHDVDDAPVPRPPLSSPALVTLFGLNLFGLNPQHRTTTPNDAQSMV